MPCGTRAQDFRPGDPDGASLLRSSSGVNHLPNGGMRTAGDTYCSAACDSATLRQPAPSPVLRLLWLGTPLPNLPVRAPAADAFTEVLPTYCTAGFCELHFRVLRTAPLAVLPTVAPDRCGPPGTVVSPVAVLHQPWLRNSTTAPSSELHLRVLLPGSSYLPGPAVSLGYERNPSHLTIRCLLQPT